MKRRGLALASLSLLAVALLAWPTMAAEADPLVVLFYEDGCSSCIDMEALLDGMLTEAPDTALVRYEIHDPESEKLLTSLTRAYGIDMPAVVPIVFIADDVIVGMGRTQEFSLRNLISDCLADGCESPLARLPMAQLKADLPRLLLFLAVFAGLVWLQLR